MNDTLRLSIAVLASVFFFAGASPSDALEGNLSGSGLSAPPAAGRKCAAGTHRVSAVGQPLRCEPDAPSCPKGTHPELTHSWSQPYACEPDQPGAVCPPGTHGVVTHRWGKPFECVANVPRNQGFNGALSAPGRYAGNAALSGCASAGSGGSGGGGCANHADPKCGCRPCGFGGGGPR